MREPRSVIVFGGALYDAPLWTNRQQIATRLAGRGWRVLYVEPRLLLWRQLFGAFPRTRGRRSWLLRQIAPQRAAANLWVQAQANLVPGSRHFPLVGRLHHLLWNGWHVRLHAWELGIRHPALLIYDTEAAEFLDDFPSARVVYDCVDDHRAEAVAHGRDPRLVEQEETAIVARASAIAVTTPPLFDRFAPLHRNVHLVPNAADVEAFATPQPEPEDMKNIPHPRMGTVGALDAYKIDVEMLTEVVRKQPEWQFVLIGPVEYARHPRGQPQGLTPGVGVWAELAALPTVHFLGPKPREAVPAYVQALDVAIIPYRQNLYNRSSFPLKCWEFLAAGKPVVASGLPSLRPYERAVTLADGAEAFARGIAAALAGGTRGAAARRVEANRHRWEHRVAALEALLL